MYIHYDGFDPLDATLKLGNNQSELLKSAKKREITNILKCYTGYFDVLSELIQNALDATEKAWRLDNNYIPKIRIEINIYENSVTISDNGCGMNKEQFEFCLAPNISFKTGEDLRGNKGVGATFLAYGFNNIKIQTKTSNFETRVIMINGKKWVEDTNSDVERPKFRTLDNPINDFLDNCNTGTTFKVTIGEGEKPKFNYLSASTSSQWFDILRIKTPLGGINISYNNRIQFKPEIEVSVIDNYNNKTITNAQNTEFYYPHDIPNLKVEELSDINDAIESIVGGADERFPKLNEKYKKLNAIYNIWDSKQILDENSPINLTTGLTEEQKQMIIKHRISVYGFFCNSTRIFDRFNDDILGIRRNYRILKGGLQLASDGMTQGDLITIPLTKSVWYQTQTYVIIHFEQGSPDLGRKTFQPENTELGVKLAVNVVNLLKKYRNHLKTDETSEPLTPSRDKYNWIREQENYAETHPLSLPANLKEKIHIIAKPQKEQDVIALYHQLIGANIFKGIDIYSTSEHNRYDSLFRLNYANDSIFYNADNVLGISPDIVQLPFISEPLVLEYKYDFDALVRECLSGEKFDEHINLVVTWDANLFYQGKVELKSLLINNRGQDSRKIYGSTHVAYKFGHYERPIYEVVILEDLLNYLIDPNREAYHQKDKYEE